MPDRDLDITKFSYFSYRKLKKALGEFDAVVECNEIAIREFVEKAEGKHSKKYIEQLSLKHKVKVNEVDFIKFASRIRQYYVSSVFQQSEQFLKDFKSEWKKYFPEKEWVERVKSETALQNTLKNILLDLPSDLQEFYEYYRLIRNYMSHTDRDLADIEKRHDKILTNSNKFLRDFHLSNLPNRLDEIDFSDFLIITNIVKHIAYLISKRAKPSNSEIAAILLELSKENKGRAFKGLTKLKNDNERFQVAIKSFTITSFGRFSSSDLNDISKKFESLLA